MANPLLHFLVEGPAASLVVLEHLRRIKVGYCALPVASVMLGLKMKPRTFLAILPLLREAQGWSGTGSGGSREGRGEMGHPELCLTFPIEFVQDTEFLWTHIKREGESKTYKLEGHFKFKNVIICSTTWSGKIS